MVKENGKIVEKVWHLGGMYGKAIERIVYWLEKAATVAENDHQRQVIEKLIDYYKTGDLKSLMSTMYFGLTIYNPGLIL